MDDEGTTAQEFCNKDSPGAGMKTEVGKRATVILQCDVALRARAHRGTIPAHGKRGRFGEGARIRGRHLRFRAPLHPMFGHLIDAFTCS